MSAGTIKPSIIVCTSVEFLQDLDEPPTDLGRLMFGYLSKLLQSFSPEETLDKDI